MIEEAYRSHVFLQPSVTASDGDSEGGAPVAIIDMAASGMPVVSSTHCDIPEVLPQAAWHLLAPERDVDGLVERLLWLTEHPDEWTVLTNACRRHVEQEFNAAAQGARLAEIYDAVLAAV